MDAKAQAQVFRRTFGDVTQFPLTSGLLKKERLTLAAICLERTGLATMGEVLKPAESIFQQIAGPDGLNFEDEAFYCVGIFSPAGWPEEWRDLAEIRSNALFYLVEKGEGTAWNVFGPEGPLRDLFDPETAGEKQARAARALADHPETDRARRSDRHECFSGRISSGPGIGRSRHSGFRRTFSDSRTQGEVLHSKVYPVGGIMSVMEKLKNLFQRDDLPDETRQLYLNAANPRDLVKGLETLRGRNEIDLRENEEELIGLEKAIILEENSIRKGGLTPTEETIILRRIERLEKQRANLEKQVSIYNENVNLHLNLIAKIQEMEAMRSRGVGEEEIDRLVDEVEDHVEEYKRVSIAAEGGCEHHARRWTSRPNAAGWRRSRNASWA